MGPIREVSLQNLESDSERMTAPLPDELTNALKAGTFSVDCTSMELRPRAGANRPVYRGAGVIRQAGAEPLELTLYDTDSQVGPGDLCGPSVAAGEWVPQEFFYDLTAIDLSGRTWQAGWIRPDTSARVGVRGIIVRGRLSELTCCSDEVGKKHWIRLFIPGDIWIPTNASTETIIDAAGRKARRVARDIWLPEGFPYKMIVTRTENGLEVECSCSTGTFPQGFDTRVEEAFWLLLGQPVQWTILEERSPNGSRAAIRTVSAPVRPARMRPPIEPHQITVLSDYALLFRLYLEHVQQCTGPQYHPTSAVLRKVLRAGTGTVEDEALALSVAVETLVRDHFSEWGTPDANTIKAAGDAATYIDEWKGPDHIRKRVRRCVDLLTEPHPQTALRKLAEIHIIQEDHVAAWAAIRNRAAHGRRLGSDVRDLVDKCERVLQLLHILIFEIIGFEGSFTDHCVRGWPLTRYPFEDEGQR